MRPLWALAVKEVKLAFRDGGAIVTMLLTPFVLTLVMGAALGGSGGGGLSDIPVLLLSRDGGPLSEELVAVFAHDRVAELIALEVVEHEAAARAQVEADEVAALVIIPADFTERMSPSGEASAAAEVPAAVVEIYASPTYRISTAIIKSVIRQGIESLNLQVRGTALVSERLAAMPPDADHAPADGGGMPTTETQLMPDGGPATNAHPIDLEVVSGSGRTFDWISYTAVNMAVLFLMFAVTTGGRTLLAERSAGTLPRLLVAPVPALSVLLGKMTGTMLTGFLQMVILWLATSLMGAYWGALPAVPIALAFLVLSASGVGAMISAWARTTWQAGAIGSAVTLVGAAVSGTFFPRAGLPDWVQLLSLVTPQAWGIELFSRLQSGLGLAEILPQLGGTLALAAVTYAVALVGFRRRLS